MRVFHTDAKYRVARHYLAVKTLQPISYSISLTIGLLSFPNGRSYLGANLHLRKENYALLSVPTNEGHPC